MAFQYYEFKEDEKREYTLTMWPRDGEKIIPGGGTVDIDNDIRLFNYGNGPETDPCDEYQFIFDYKAIVMNINIKQKVTENDVYYTLLEVEGNNNINKDEFLPALRDAIFFWANKKWNRFGKYDPDSFIHIEF